MLNLARLPHLQQYNVIGRHNLLDMVDKKLLDEAAKAHAKEQLGEEQFAKNKDAVRAITEDFKAGAEWMKKQLGTKS